MSNPTVERAARKFQRSMQGLADESGSTISLKAGDGPEVTVAAPGGVIPPDPDVPFILAPEVHDVADELMDRFPSFAHLHEHRLAYLFQTTMPKPRGGCQAIGRAHVVNDLYEVVTGGINGIVVVNQPWWATATDRQRQALVYHELCHFETHPETGDLKTVKHDLELFIGEAERFGDWRVGIRDVADQLSMWDRNERDD